jgi:hypothetical protein
MLERILRTRLRVNAGVLLIAIWIVVLLGLVEKVNNNQTSGFW